MKVGFKMGMTIIAIVSLIASGCGSSGPESELQKAARRGDVEKVQALIDNGMDVNEVIGGLTALQKAAKAGESETMSILLENGADPTVEDSYGKDLWELLFPANRSSVGERSERCLVVLLDFGFEDRIDIIEAAKKINEKELIEKLIALGADVNAMDENGWTPLHLAGFEGHQETCVALLEAGANPNAETTKQLAKIGRNQDGSTYFQWHYEPGSRPVDVAESFSPRGRKSCRKIITEHGGKQNDQIKNQRR